MQLPKRVKDNSAPLCPDPSPKEELGRRARWRQRVPLTLHLVRCPEPFLLPAAGVCQPCPPTPMMSHVTTGDRSLYEGSKGYLCSSALPPTSWVLWTRPFSWPQSLQLCVKMREATSSLRPSSVEGSPLNTYFDDQCLGAGQAQCLLLVTFSTRYNRQSNMCTVFTHFSVRELEHIRGHS